MSPATIGEERRRRAALIERMGGICQETREVCFEVKGLEFDHPKGRRWSPRKLSRLQRMARYEADHRAGRLRLLCRSHNAVDGGKRRWGRVA